MWAKQKFISPIVIVALVVGWILVLLPSVTPPAEGDLYLSRLVEKERNYEVRFGILDWAPGRNGLSPTRRPNSGSQQNTGYQAVFSFPLESTSDDPNGRPITGPPSLTVWLFDQKDTEALVLFPVTLGMLAIAIICYIPGAIKTSGAWLGVSALFAFVASALGWTAWGYAYTLNDKIESSLSRYLNRPNSIWNLEVERGDVIWAGMVGMILVTIAAILILIKVIIRPEKTNEAEQRELSTLPGGKQERHNDTSMSSNETLTNP